MKLLLPISTSLLITVGTLFAAPGKDDPIEKGLKDAYKAYQDGEYGEVTETLQHLLKLMEEKNAEKLEALLPDRIDGWAGEDLKREDLAAVGGGVSLERIYQQGNKSITIKIVMDSPLVDEWLKLLANDELIRASGKKTYHISGETAILEEELKILIAVGGEILVELKGDNDCRDSDLVSLARKLDLGTLKRMK